MKLIIAGGRDFGDYDYACRCLAKLKTRPSYVICGMQHGADYCGYLWAEENLGRDKIIPVWPDWQAYGKKAGPLRNQEMARIADALVVFWDGQSRGTASMIREMEKLGKPLKVFKYE